MVTTLSPNVRDTPTRPMPTWGKPAAMTALPHPANVSQNVPINSAAYFLVSMGHLRDSHFRFALPQRENPPKKQQIRERRHSAAAILWFSAGLLGRNSACTGRHLA